jgi:hypothetical protein
MVSTNNNNDSGNDGKQKEPKKPKPVVVASKKRIVVTTKRRRRTQQAAAATTGVKRRAVGGLPSFRARQAAPPNTSTTESSTTAINDPDTDPDPDPTYGGIDDLEFPSDCLLAIQNLHRSLQGLHIPITQRISISSSSSSSSSNATAPSSSINTIQVLLESQIFQRFKEHHASTIYQELVELKRTNVIRLLHCPIDSSSTTTTTNNVWILTRDYITGVWDSRSHHHHHPAPQPPQQQQSRQVEEIILSWFVTNLQSWTESTLSESAMQESWTHQTISFDTAMRQLLRLRVLMRDTSTTTKHPRYHLWLPKWGIVIKAWNEARHQLLTFVSLKKEISERNVLSKNRHVCVSTKFLLDELVHQGKLRIMERPFGRFVRKGQ